MQKLLAQDLNDEDFKFTNETLQPTPSVVIPGQVFIINTKQKYIYFL